MNELPGFRADMNAAATGPEAVPPSELARLTGEAVVLRRLLGQAADVIATIEPENTTEADLLKELRRDIDAALNPKPPAGGLF